MSVKFIASEKRRAVLTVIQTGTCLSAVFTIVCVVSRQSWFFSRSDSVSTWPYVLEVDKHGPY
jgi:hypothetical protein